MLSKTPHVNMPFLHIPCPHNFVFAAALEAFHSKTHINFSVLIFSVPGVIEEIEVFPLLQSFWSTKITSESVYHCKFVASDRQDHT